MPTSAYDSDSSSDSLTVTSSLISRRPFSALSSLVIVEELDQMLPGRRILLNPNFQLTRIRRLAVTRHERGSPVVPENVLRDYSSFQLTAS